MLQGSNTQTLPLPLKGTNATFKRENEVKQVKNRRSAHKILSQSGNGTREYCISVTVEFLHFQAGTHSVEQPQRFTQNLSTLGNFRPAFLPLRY